MTFPELNKPQPEQAASTADPNIIGLPQSRSFQPLESLAQFVVAARVQAATWMFCLTLAACSPNPGGPFQADNYYKQAQALYIQNNPGGEIDLHTARELVMMRDHARLVRDVADTEENWADFHRDVYQPLQTFVKEHIDRERAATDPIGAVKDAMFSYISPGLLYNRDCDNMFSSLDREQPRAQCLACTTLAAMLLTDPEVAVQIPDQRTAVFVYTDTHVFLGMVDDQSQRLETHEMTTRGSSSPVDWGSLDDANIPRPSMRVASIAAVFDGIARGKAPAYIFDHVPASGNFITGGNTPGVDSGLKAPRANSDTIPSDPGRGRDHGQLGAFSSGRVEVPSGDRPFPTHPITSASNYLMGGGVYSSGEGTRGSFADSLSRTVEEAPSVTSTLEQRLAQATATLDPAEKRIFLDFFRHADALYAIRNGITDSYNYLTTSHTAEPKREQAARDCIARLARRFESYWDDHNLDEYARRSLSARQKVVDAGWTFTDPVAIRANFRTYCARIGVPYPD